mmetsp:Transcript_77411/g.196698  ORF Transcript_77411/g.196698 Transcript_77411/m.196698 type:complete len:264 (-) Transcript_77411:211-1002(-)
MLALRALPDVPGDARVDGVVAAALRLGIGVADVPVLEAIEVHQPAVLLGPIPDHVAASVGLSEGRSSGVEAQEVVASIHDDILLRSLPSQKLYHRRCHRGDQAAIRHVAPTCSIANVPHEAWCARAQRTPRLGVGATSLGLISEPGFVQEPPVCRRPISEAGAARRADLAVGHPALVEAHQPVLAPQLRVLRGPARRPEDLQRRWCRGRDELGVTDVLLVLGLPDAPNKVLPRRMLRAALFRIGAANVRLLETLAVDDPPVRG